MSLSAASQWAEMVEGYDYRSLYLYVIDYFEERDTDEEIKEAEELLVWWNRCVYSVSYDDQC